MQKNHTKKVPASVKKTIVPPAAPVEKSHKVILKNDDLQTFLSWLNVPMHSEKARARNHVFGVLKNAWDKFEAERVKLLETYKVKKDGKDVKYTNARGVEVFKLKDEKKWGLVWLKLSAEKVTFDVEPKDAPAWRIIRTFIKDTKTEMDVETTKWWEDVVAALEQI